MRLLAYVLLAVLGACAGMVLFWALVLGASLWLCAGRRR